MSITALDMVQSTKRSISSLISRFKELMNGQIQKNIDELVQYQLKVDDNLRHQDVIVGDYVLLTDKVLGENLKLIQLQYQDVSKELK